jgi:hypothetical protein
MKKIYTILIFAAFFVSFLPAHALTKPGPDANIEGLSYVFYLYYDNGQLFGDRDVDVKFDVIDEVFAPKTVAEGTGFKGEIVNLKSEVVSTFQFDPRQDNASFTKGKITVKGPYVPDGQKVNFLNAQGETLLTIFIGGASICNDDGSCNVSAGETEKTCSNDCKKARPTPAPIVVEQPNSLGLGFDWNSILIYVVGTLGVLVVGWLGWKWWKKHRESAFEMPPPPSTPPPPPPTEPGGQNLR